MLVEHLRAKTNTIPELRNLLSDSLARTGWTDRVRALTLELLRSGKYDTFPEVFEEVLHRCKVPRDAEIKSEEPTSKTGGKTVPGHSHKDKDSDASMNANGNNGAIAVREGWFGPDGLPDVKIPVATVEAGVEFLKEKVRDAVEFEDDD